MTSHSHIRRLWLAAAALLPLLACAKEEAKPSTEQIITSMVTGEWVEIYPRWEEGLTLTMRADSSAAGTLFDADSAGGGATVTGWMIGTPAMPAGLCLRFGEQYNCQAFDVRGDTLFLADLRRSVLVRPRALNRTLRFVPSSSPPPPVPGDSGFRVSDP
jgi:hypothetical protein